MTSLVARAFAAANTDFKSFWDSFVKPEIKVAEAALENLQKELAPIEEADLKIVVGAGIAAAAAASGGVVPATFAAAIPSLEAGVGAMLATAEKQGVTLSVQAATTLLAGATVQQPVVANGANG